MGRFLSRFPLALAALLTACDSRGHTPGNGGGAAGVTLAPPRVALGIVPPGAVKTSSVTVHNRTRAPLEVADVESSCPCVRIGPVPLRIDPGRSARMDVTFDPAEEPDFRGALAVEFTGRDASRRKVFGGHVDLEVRWQGGE